MIPYSRQQITAEDSEIVGCALFDDIITRGHMVERFEQAIADYCGTSA